jgi:hypothetical protein
VDIGKVQALHASLSRLRDLTNKLMGARYQGVNTLEALDPHKKLARQLSEEVRLVEEHIEDLAGDLAEASNERKDSTKPIAVRAHKRVKSKKPRTLEEAGGDASKLPSVDEVLEDPTILEDMAETTISPSTPINTFPGKPAKGEG